VESCYTICGAGFMLRGQNVGLAWVRLKDWELRDRPELKVGALAGRATEEFSKIRSAQVFAFAPPSVNELGMAKGFDFQLLDRGGLGHQKLMEARNQLLDMAGKDPILTKVRSHGLEDVPNTGLTWIGRRPAPWGFPSHRSTTPSRQPSQRLYQ